MNLIVASAIVFSKLFTYVFRVLNFVFLATSLSTTSLVFFNSTGTVFNLPTSKSSTFVSKLFKIVGALKSVLMFSLSLSALQSKKTFFAVRSDVLTPIT